jgi:hypothetical protein
MRRLTLVAGLVFAAIPTVVGAHAGNADPAVVHACVGNATKVARIVGVNGVCLASPPLVAETAVHWSIVGPQGEPGQNGTNGTSGANGINGIDGTSVTFVSYFSGTQNGCANGGAVYAAGNPPVNAYVCNGTDGTGGGTRPDPPCFDNINRYVNCGNGTVTDTATGLIWLQQADCIRPAATSSGHDWAAANAAAAHLKDGDCGGNLTDNSSPGDWRLPTKAEWQATTAAAIAVGCTSQGPGISPAVTNDRGNACLSVGLSSFTGVKSLLHWSSTPTEFDAAGAWLQSLSDGFVYSFFKNVALGRVWPVRGGAR